MTCKECEAAQIENIHYFVRIENANVMVLGCRDHVKILLERLRQEAHRNTSGSDRKPKQ